MGLFDFSKKKKATDDDANSLLLRKLKERLEKMSYHVQLREHSVVIESQLEIQVEIIKDESLSPLMLHLHIVLLNQYLPGGIDEHLVGVGEELHSQIDSALNNFLSVSFPPVLDAFSESHKTDLDFKTEIAGRAVLFHPKMGDLGFQGEWQTYPENTIFFELLKDGIKDKLQDRKFNWLKIYVAKVNQGQIRVQCSLNNEDWQEGMQIVLEYVNSWGEVKSFKAIKQTIMFRLCDAYENLI